MIRLLAVAVFALAAVAMSVLPARAAGNSGHGPSVDWNRHDTAVYVVSTLNVLRTRSGKPVSTLLAHRFGAIHYEVYGDATVTDLYFIFLRKPDASTVAVLAYQMGWPRPMAVTSTLHRFGIRPAPDKIVQDFKTDPKIFFDSFTSTLPQ